MAKCGCTSKPKYGGWFARIIGTTILLRFFVLHAQSIIGYRTISTSNAIKYMYMSVAIDLSEGMTPHTSVERGEKKNVPKKIKIKKKKISFFSYDTSRGGPKGAFEPKFCLWESQNYNLLVKSICSL